MEKKIYHIVAMSENRVIGMENRLPWHFSIDLKKFKEITLGSTVIMGRRTFESIGRPLPGRENFVLTHRPTGNMAGENPRFFGSLKEAVEAAKGEKIFIIGGESLYQQTIDQISGIYVTRIHQNFQGDAYYPEIPGFFKEVSRELLQEDPKIEFIYFENTKKQPLTPSLSPSGGEGGR